MIVEQRRFWRLLRLQAGEGAALALSFAYFALLLASYYMIRPLRDSLAAGVGADQIKYLSTAVFLTMLAIVPVFGWLVARVRRERLLPCIYAFFVTHLLGFAVAFAVAPDAPWTARTFYVWVSVFNFFVVAVFWSFMADLWREEQGRRLFGVIAAGGSLGGLVGPALTRTLVHEVGLAGIALLSAAFLAGTLVAILLLLRLARTGGGLARPRLQEVVGGHAFAGLTRLVRTPFLLGIAGLIVVGALIGMIVYIELARLAAAEYPTAAARTAFYSQRDLWVNAGALLCQLLLVGAIASRYGVQSALVGVGLLAVAAFAVLGVVPVLATLLGVNVAMRVLEYGVAKPARDMLYTVVDPETRYKVKNAIDTAVYRGSDMASGWAHGALAAAGLGLVGFAWLSSALALVLVALGIAVGAGYRRRGGR